VKITPKIFQNFFCDINYSKELMFVVYQVGLASSYIQDKLDIETTDVFEFDEHREVNSVLHG